MWVARFSLNKIEKLKLFYSNAVIQINKPFSVKSFVMKTTFRLLFIIFSLKLRIIPLNC